MVAGRGCSAARITTPGLLNDYFPGLPTTGIFSKVQIGPVGDRSFAHGYTAAIALLTPGAPKRK